jgi:di- and tripeptidase
MSAQASAWRSNPFNLTGLNGYLYGRGVSDNKGPLVAAACAVATLLARRALDCDVVFLVEGEEEEGSGGFAESVRKYKVCSFQYAFGRELRLTLVPLV